MISIRKYIYNVYINLILRTLIWPFKNLLPERFKIPVNGVIKVNLEDKKIYFTANETSPMLRELYWNYYNCNFEFSEIFIEIVKNSKVFFDIGANIGYYSLISTKANPNVKVFSFEPSNGPFHFLEKNIELNMAKNVKALKIAVTDHNDDIEFFEDINPKYKYQKYHVSGTGNTVNTWNNNNTNKYLVSGIRIDDLVIKEKLESLDLIKIDTEGTEDKVLIGALNTIKKFQPIIICEVLPNKIESEILDIVLELDYLIYHHIEEFNKLEKVEKFDASSNRNFIFVPNSKIQLISKFI